MPARTIHEEKAKSLGRERYGKGAIESISQKDSD